MAGKLKAAFEDLGEKSVKNIAPPVRVYRVLRDPQAQPAARRAAQPTAVRDVWQTRRSGFPHALGRADEARREAQEVLRHEPGFRLSALEGRLAIVKDRELVARFLQLLRELGLQ